MGSTTFIGFQSDVWSFHMIFAMFYPSIFELVLEDSQIRDFC